MYQFIIISMLCTVRKYYVDLNFIKKKIAISVRCRNSLII